jgi:hypothetical protein
MMAYSKQSWFTCLIVRSGRRAFSAAHRLSGSSSFSLRGPTFPIVFPIFYHIGIHVTRESFFCEVTLELSYCKSCLVNNLPFGSKEYSSRQTCLFVISALLKAEKSSHHLKPNGFDKREIKIQATWQQQNSTTD